ncbi:MAG: epoxyqueuosine reductase [Phycisphaerales bacterium]
MTGEGIRRRDAVVALARELGFARVGVVAAGPSPQAAMFERWIAGERHGSMGWMADHRALRADPRGLLPGAASIICVADRYAGPGEPPPLHASPTDGHASGRIARYARGRDYHKVLKRRLHAMADALHTLWPPEPPESPDARNPSTSKSSQLSAPPELPDAPASSNEPAERAQSGPPTERAARFRACTDTAPILERELAARAGLGRIGKHTLLIEPGVGSWMLLGELLTTVPIAPSDESTAEFASPCGSCTRCIDACPTQCIEPWSVDARRCIAYLTIEHRERIDPALHGAIGDWVFGCDACQLACPHVRPTRRSRRAPVHADYAPRHAAFELIEMIGWTEADRRSICGGTAMTRAKLPMLRRNALIAAGNVLLEEDQLTVAERERLRHAIEACRGDADSLVRQTAEDVLGRLSD